MEERIEKILERLPVVVAEIAAITGVVLPIEEDIKSLRILQETGELEGIPARDFERNFNLLEMSLDLVVPMLKGEAVEQSEVLDFISLCFAS